MFCFTSAARLSPSFYRWVASSTRNLWWRHFRGLKIKNYILRSPTSLASLCKYVLLCVVCWFSYFDQFNFVFRSISCASVRAPVYVCDDWCSVIIKHSVLCPSLFCRCTFRHLRWQFFLSFSFSCLIFFLSSFRCFVRPINYTKCMESHLFWNIINFDEEFLCYSTEYKSWWHYIRAHTHTYEKCNVHAALLS